MQRLQGIGDEPNVTRSGRGSETRILYIKTYRGIYHGRMYQCAGFLHDPFLSMPHHEYPSLFFLEETSHEAALCNLDKHPLYYSVCVKGWGERREDDEVGQGGQDCF